MDGVSPDVGTGDREVRAVPRDVAGLVDSVDCPRSILELALGGKVFGEEERVDQVVLVCDFQLEEGIGHVFAP